MSPEEAEARSPYASNPTTSGYGGGTYARTGTQVQDDYRRQQNEEYYRQQQQQQNQQQGSSRIVSVQRWDNQQGRWVQEDPVAYQQRARDAMAARSNFDPVLAERAKASEGVDTTDPFSHRADVYPVSDPQQRALMDTGLTAYQAAEKLRFEAQQRGDYAGERKYDTLLMQAWTTETGKSAEYHFQAKESGLAQAPNPYEYTADMLTYVMKGEPQKKSERFSPVDYSLLNLPEGRGQQAHVWEERPSYDLRPQMDIVARSARRGDMGAYGQLGTPTSSTHGKLSLEEQQAIGRYVNENPVHQANGFITRDTMGKFTPEVRNMDRGTFVPSVTPGMAQPGGQVDEVGFKRPFMSYGEERSETVYRPSDATLALMNMPDAGGRGQAIKKGLIFVSELVTPGTYEKTITGRTATVDRKSIGAELSQQDIDALKAQHPGAVVEGGVMKWAVGNPYEKGGKIYQDYESVDLNKVTVTPQWKQTVQGQTGLERGWNEANRAGSDLVYEKVGGVFGVTGEQARQAVGISNVLAVERANARPSVETVGQSFGAGMIKGTLDKPVESGLMFAVSYGSGVALKGVASVGAKALPVIAEKSPVAAQAIRTSWKAAPFVLATAYTADASGRITEGGTDFRPGQMSNRAGVITATEVAPMVAGFGGAEFTFKQGLGSFGAVKRGVVEDYRQVKLEAMNQGRPSTPRSYSVETMTGEPTGIKDWSGSKMRVEARTAGNPLPPSTAPKQVAQMPEISQGQAKLPKGYEPGLGRNVDGEIQFDVSDYLAFKGRQVVANTGARASIAKDTILNAPTEIGVRVSGKVKPAIMGLRVKSAAVRTEVGKFPEKVTGAFESMKSRASATPKPEITRSYTPYEGIEKTAYRGDRWRDPLGFNKAAKPEVSPEYAPAEAWRKAEVPGDQYFGGGRQQATPEQFYTSLGEKAYGAPKTNQERLLMAEQFFDELPGRLVTGKWDKFGGGAAPVITKGKPPAPGVKGAEQKYTRVAGTKIVGGVKTPALTKEPAGLPKGSVSVSGGGAATGQGAVSASVSIGQRTDFRTMPRGSMKPFTKQAAGVPGLLTEQLPEVEGMSTTRMSVNARSSGGLVSVVQPELNFRQPQESGQDSRLGLATAFALRSRFGQQSGIRQELGLRSGQDTAQRMREQQMGREFARLPIRGVLPIRGGTTGQDRTQIFRTDEIRITDITQRQREKQDVVPVQDQYRITITDQQQRYRQQTFMDERQRMRFPTVAPLPIAMIGGGGGSGGLRPRRGRKHTEYLNTGFGTITADMFGSGGLGGGEFGGEGKAPRRKSVYGNYRGTFMTGKGKTIRVKPLPKRYYS